MIKLEGPGGKQITIDGGRMDGNSLPALADINLVEARMALGLMSLAAVPDREEAVAMWLKDQRGYRTMERKDPEPDDTEPELTMEPDY